MDRKDCRVMPLLVFLLALPVSVTGAEMYQWVDADGKRHFTDKPPPAGVVAERAVLRPAPEISGGALSADRANPEDESSTGRSAQQAAALANQREQARRAREADGRARAAAEEDRMQAQRRQQEVRERTEKEEKCKRLKDVADKAYAFKARYEKECR